MHTADPRSTTHNERLASECLTLLPAAGLPPAHLRRQTSDLLRDAWRRQAWRRRWTEDDIATFGLDVIARRA
jgi:hypothetical protein